MKNKRSVLILVLAINVMLALVLIHDYKKPDCVEAQSCISVPPANPSVSIDCSSGLTFLGCHDFCAVSRLYGIDDTSSEGFHINDGGSCEGDKRYWTITKGGDVDGFGACCWDFNW